MIKKIGLGLTHEFNPLEDGGEIIPLMSEEDETFFKNHEVPDELPILPLRNTVLFPGVVIPITIGREKSLQLIKAANQGKKLLGVVCQKNHDLDDPGFSDLHSTGTLAHIVRLLKMPDGSNTVILQGRKRITIDSFSQVEPYFKAKVVDFPESIPPKNDVEFDILVKTVRDESMALIKENGQLPAEAAMALKNIDSASFLINFVSSKLQIENTEKQSWLELSNFQERGERLMGHLLRERSFLQIKNDLHSKVC